MKIIEKSVIFEIANSVAKDHLEPHGAVFAIEYIDVGTYYINFTVGKEQFSKSVYIKNMPEEICKEYMHCCIHELAAMLLRRLYPIC